MLLFQSINFFFHAVKVARVNSRRSKVLRKLSILNKKRRLELSERQAAELYREVFQKSDEELNFDGEEGQQLLRILLQMTMSDFSKLTSTALRVLFRHFTQYQELVDDLKQVSAILKGFFST